MYKVKKLYVKFDDEDGHSYLIDKDMWEAFDEAMSDLLDALYTEDIERYYNEVDKLFDIYNVNRIEGEEVYIVLPDDIIIECF